MPRTGCISLTAALLAVIAGSPRAQDVKRTFAVKVGDKVVGWQVETERRSGEGAAAIREVTIENLVKLELLGAGVDQRVRQTWRVHARTGWVEHVHSELSAGLTRLVVTGGRTGDRFTWTVQPSGGPTEPLELTQAVVAPDYRFLLRPEFQGCKQHAFTWFMPETGGPQRAVASALDEREFDVLGTPRRARGWSIDVPALGVAMTVFLDGDGEIVHSEVPAMDMVIAPATAAAIERLQRVDITHTFVGKTNLRLDDPTPVTYTKVKVRIETTPDITAEGLAAPGQTFTGTAAAGVVEGVFEIRIPRHDGKGALPFPIPEGAVAAPELQPFLRPEPNIECDDPAIAARARELAQGATTAFEVVRRCADWMHANITYEIPGGGSAKRVLETRRGECGGHSHLLAAMLRSLGIPARTPMGGMYVPMNGGSFGQHMWNEAWLGLGIGWLPVDCTIGQSTFVDSTHIRLRVGMTAFRPKSLEVLDWEPKGITPPAPTGRLSTPFPWTKGETWTYTWRRGTTPIGTESTTYAGAEGEAHTFTSSLDLAGGRLTESVRTVVGADGRLRSAHVDRTAGETKASFTMQVQGTAGTVEQRVGDEEARHECEVEDGAFALHNNCITHFAILVSRLPELAEGAEVRLGLLHDESHQPLGLVLRGAGPTTIELGGTPTKARKLEATLAGMRFELHVDDRGRLLRWWQEQGDIAAELDR